MYFQKFLYFFLYSLLLFILFPFNISKLHAISPPSSWNSMGVGGGGALFSPSFSPFNPKEIYLTCDMSGIYHSLDLGTSWSMVNFSKIQGGRPAKIQFTSNPNILFTIDNSNDLLTPTKSIDGGVTWTQLSADSTFGGAFGLIVDPTTTNRLFISDYDNLYFSNNGGASFSFKLSAPNGGYGCYLSGAFFDGNNIYLATNTALLISTNGGTSFTTSTVSGISTSEEIFCFSGAKQNGTTRFFALTAPKPSIYPGILIEDFFGMAQPLKVYTVDWGLGNWSQKQTGVDASYRVVFIAAPTNNINTAYLAGGYNGSDWPVVYKSSNGGNNWQTVLLTTTNQNIYTGWDGNNGDRDWSYGGGIVGFTVAPNDPNKLAFTDYGFIHISTNGGNTFQQAYLNPADENPINTLTPKGKAYHGNGLENTSCWNLCWHDSQNIWGCYSDIRGIRSTDAGSSWSFNYTGHTDNTSYACVKNPSNGILYIATSNIHDMYESTHLTDATIDGGTGKVLYSTDTGKTWLTLHNFSHPVIDLAIDPNQPNTMYASVINSSSGGIFVSYNINSAASSTWTKLNNPPRTQGHPFNIKVLNDGSLVCTYSGRRTSVFTDSSGVFLMLSGTTTWLDRTGAYMHYWTKDVIIDSFDTTQKTWYAGVYSGYGGPLSTNNQAGGLYKTIDRGSTWSLLTGIYRVGSCAINPTNQNEMYLTTETNGLWYSSNLHTGSPTFSLVSSFPFRQPERVFFNPYNTNQIWVTTFGNGIYYADTSVPIHDWKKYF